MCLTLGCQLFVVNRLIGRFGVGVHTDAAAGDRRRGILADRICTDAGSPDRFPGAAPGGRIRDRAPGARDSVHGSEPRRKIQIEELHRHGRVPRRRRGERLAVRGPAHPRPGVFRHCVRRRADRDAVGGHRLDARPHPGGNAHQTRRAQEEEKPMHPKSDQPGTRRRADVAGAGGDGAWLAMGSLSFADAARRSP